MCHDLRVSEEPSKPARPSSEDGAAYWRSLTKWERIGAVAAGSVIGALGFLAMFWSGNQAGPAVALLIAGVLILLGIQGTPLAKVGAKDYGVEMGRTREAIAGVAVELALAKPDEANALLRGYEAADPGARRSAAIADAADIVYRRQAQRALLRVAGGLGLEVEEGPVGSAWRVRAGDVVMAVYAHGLDTAGHTREAEHVIDAAALAATSGVEAVLAITPSVWIQHAIADPASRRSGIPVEIACWGGAADDDQIVEAVQRLKLKVAAAREPRSPQ